MGGRIPMQVFMEHGSPGIASCADGIDCPTLVKGVVKAASGLDYGLLGLLSVLSFILLASVSAFIVWRKGKNERFKVNP